MRQVSVELHFDVEIGRTKLDFSDDLDLERPTGAAGAERDVFVVALVAEFARVLLRRRVITPVSLHAGTLIAPGSLQSPCAYARVLRHFAPLRLQRCAVFKVLARGRSPNGKCGAIFPA